MKSTERHKLKENEFASSVSRARSVIDTRRGDISRIVIVGMVIAAVIGGYSVWRQSRHAKASAAMAAGLAIYEAPVMAAPAAPAPGSPMPVQQAGTYATEQAKFEAALPRLLEAANQYPNTDAGIVARYYAASALASLGRYPEAEQRFQEVVDKAGSGIYARTGKLGVADAQVAQGKFDNAITIYREMSADSSSAVPLDGVLMELGRTYLRAGRKDEAARTFSRIVDEFPQSAYVADAKRELAEARKG
ncbi:MAG TPA: tetratricopeptide repeat protein [Vicinamibacterales bacterium]|nr:tetratricopeptide repeat protein [Vicinamibacterales bacterium]